MPGQEFWPVGVPREETVQAFLAAILRQMQGYVSDEEVHDILPTVMQGFHITT